VREKDHPKSRQPERSGGKPAGKPAGKLTGRGHVALFGFHAVANAWLNPARPCHRLLLSGQSPRTLEATLNQAKKMGLKRPSPEIVDAKVIDRLLGPGMVHQGIYLEADNPPEVEIEDIIDRAGEKSCVVILDQVTDPHNVGAILRTACAFGVEALVMTDRHAAAATGTLAKTASGALEHTPMVRLTNLAQGLAKLQKAGYWCIGLAEEGPHPLHAIKMPPRVALVLGAEGEGLRRLTRESCDEIAHLPTKPPVGSLNVSNAAAVAIYEIMRGR
jgi:23S rRNA (guanosine2251-2'-O)-methyltransferase